MKTKQSLFRLVAIVGAVTLMATPPAFARAPARRAVTHPIPPDQSKAVRPVFENYLKIQTALAQDSLEGVSERAAAIARAVRTDPARALPFRIADRADKLARAKNLAQARSALLRLSPPLTEYAKKTRLPGLYEGWCRMHWAYWLQAGTTINNPYCGKAIPKCGRIRDLNGRWIS